MKPFRMTQAARRAIREGGAVLLGEHHGRANETAEELALLRAASALGARTLVVEIPSVAQAAIDRMVRRPTAGSMARVDCAELPDATQEMTRYFRAAIGGRVPRAAIALPGWWAGRLAAVREYQLWAAAHRFGFRVVAGDASGVPPGRLSVIPRNRVLAAAIAREAEAGPVVAVVGYRHIPGLVLRLGRLGVPTVALSAHSPEQHAQVVDKVRVANRIERVRINGNGSSAMVLAGT